MSHQSGLVSKDESILTVNGTLPVVSIHVWYISLHLPPRSSIHVDKYTIHGLVGGFKHFLFSSLLGEMIQFD